MAAFLFIELSDKCYPSCFFATIEIAVHGIIFNKEISMALQKKFVSFLFSRLALSFSFALILNNSVLAQDMLLGCNPKWTGVYAGIGAGMGGWAIDNKFTVDGHAITATETAGGFGGFGTLIVGYDYLFPYSILAGVFIDGDLGHLSGTMGNGGLVGTINETGSWQLGARLGGTINSVFLPYLSTGYSKAHFDSVNFDIDLPGGAFTGLSVPGFSAGGWFLGAGLEGKITANWSIKGEYRFAFYNRDNLLASGTIDGAVPVSGLYFSEKPVVQSFQATLIYKI